VRWLGAGSYGKVVLASVRTPKHPNGIEVAIKRSKRKDEVTLAQFTAEQRVSDHSQLINNPFATRLTD